jgi:hypothetical protein
VRNTTTTRVNGRHLAYRLLEIVQCLGFENEETELLTANGAPLPQITKLQCAFELHMSQTPLHVSITCVTVWNCSMHKFHTPPGTRMRRKPFCRVVVALAPIFSLRLVFLAAASSVAVWLFGTNNNAVAASLGNARAWSAVNCSDCCHCHPGVVMLEAALKPLVTCHTCHNQYNNATYSIKRLLVPGFQAIRALCHSNAQFIGRCTFDLAH